MGRFNELVGDQYFGYDRSAGVKPTNNTSNSPKTIFEEYRSIFPQAVPDTTINEVIEQTEGGIYDFTTM